MNNKIFYIIILLGGIIVGYFVSNNEFFSNTEPNQQKTEIIHANLNISTSTIIDGNKVVLQESHNEVVFEDFHGSKNISNKFSFEYPNSWNSTAQYLSPQKIIFHSIYNVEAPAYYDLISEDIFKDSEIKYQIEHSKKNKPDSTEKIDGVTFKRYDLIDYGTYGGESAGRVIIYLGPVIRIDGMDYILVFHWEEKPLTKIIANNNPNIFEQIVRSVKFY